MNRFRERNGKDAPKLSIRKRDVVDFGWLTRKSNFVSEVDITPERVECADVGGGYGAQPDQVCEGCTIDVRPAPRMAMRPGKPG